MNLPQENFDKTLSSIYDNMVKREQKYKLYSENFYDAEDDFVDSLSDDGVMHIDEF